MRWDADGWLRTLDGGSLPTLETPAPDLLAHPGHPFPETPARNDFDSPHPDIDFQRLRTPHPEEIFSLTARPGFLRVTGCDTFGSFFTQALVTRRQEAHCSTAATVIEFEPDHFQQPAGLVCYYSSTKPHYFHLTRDDTAGKHLRGQLCSENQSQSG